MKEENKDKSEMLHKKLDGIKRLMHPRDSLANYVCLFGCEDKFECEVLGCCNIMQDVINIFERHENQIQRELYQEMIKVRKEIKAL
jgi:hypothetical protein